MTIGEAEPEESAAELIVRWAVDTRSLTHRHSCGEPLQVDVVCHHCGRPVTHDTIHTELAGN